MRDTFTLVIRDHSTFIKVWSATKRTVYNSDSNTPAKYLKGNTALDQRIRT